MKKTIYLLISLMLLLTSVTISRAEEAGIATMMRPYIEADMEHVWVRKAPKGKISAYGTLVKLDNNEIFCTFMERSRDPVTGSPWTVRDEIILWTISRDGGHTWPSASKAWPETKNVIYKNPHVRPGNITGTGYFAKDGRLLAPFCITSPKTEERPTKDNWGKMYMATSTDRGEIWKLPRIELPLVYGAAHGGIVKLKDGTLLLNVWGAVELGSWRHQAAILRSTDDGKSWSDYTIIGEHDDYDGGPAKLNETDSVETISGKLISMSRTQYGGYNPLYQGTSFDGGRTWTAKRSELNGLCPALDYTTKVGPPEGIVVLAYHDRYGKHAVKGGMYIAFSCDEGQSWGEPMWFSGGAYPCVIETEPGQMFCTYYRGLSELRGVFFDVPFPTGLRALPGMEDYEQVGITVKWDAYHGKAGEKYEYHIYRSTKPEVPLTQPALVSSGRNINCYIDKKVEKGQTYYYRVAAYIDGKIASRSWLASAKPAIRKRPSPEEVALTKGNLAPNPSFELFGGKADDDTPDRIGDHVIQQRPGSDLKCYMVSGGKFGKYCAKLDNSKGTVAGYIYFVFDNKDPKKAYRHTAFVRCDQSGLTYCGAKLSRDWQKVVINERFQQRSRQPWVFIDAPAKQVIYVDGVKFRELK